MPDADADADADTDADADRAAGTDLVPPSGRPICIDGLNVACWGGMPPALRLPLSLAAGLLAHGLAPWLCFDASTPYRLPADDRALWPQVLRLPIVTVAPSGVPADRLLLRTARDGHGLVISRDRFRDQRRRHRRLIDDPSRVSGGRLHDDHLDLPLPGLVLPLAADSRSALQQIASLLPPPAG